MMLRHGLNLRLAFVALAALLCLAVAVPATVLAAPDAKGTACDALGDFNPEGGNCNNPGGTKVNNLITQVINILSLAGGVIAVIMLIIGGLKYVTSQGDTAKATSARNTILYALIGLVVVALAQVIVKFVLKQDL